METVAEARTHSCNCLCRCRKPRPLAAQARHHVRQRWTHRWRVARLNRPIVRDARFRAKAQFARSVGAKSLSRTGRAGAGCGGARFAVAARRDLTVAASGAASTAASSDRDRDSTAASSPSSDFIRPVATPPEDSPVNRSQSFLFRKERVSIVISPQGVSPQPSPRPAESPRSVDSGRDSLTTTVRHFIRSFERRLDGLEPVPLDLQKAVLRTADVPHRGCGRLRR